MGNSKSAGTPTPPLTGNSLHQSLEEATRQYAFPDSQPLNPQQRAVDWTVDSRVSWRVEPGTSPTDNVLVEERHRGDWVQNKRLTYGLEKPGTSMTKVEAFKNLEDRVRTEAATTATKFDSGLIDPSGKFRTLPNGQRYKIEIRRPDSVTLHMEIPDWSALTAEQRRTLYEAASKELSQTAHRNVRLILTDPVPDSMVKKVGLSANEILPAAQRLLAKIEGKTLLTAQKAAARATVAEAAQFALRRGGKGLVKIGGVVFLLAIVGTGVYLTKDMDDEERVQFLGEIGVDFAAGLALDAIVAATLTRLVGAGVAETVGGWPVLLATTIQDDRHRSPERHAAEAFVAKYFPDEINSDEKIGEVMRDMAIAMPANFNDDERQPRVARMLRVGRADEPVRTKRVSEKSPASQSQMAASSGPARPPARPIHPAAPDFSGLHRAADEAIRRRAVQDAQFRRAPSAGGIIPEARAAAQAALNAQTTKGLQPRGDSAAMRAAARQAAAMAQDKAGRPISNPSPAYRAPIFQPPIAPIGSPSVMPPTQTMPPVMTLPVVTMPTPPAPIPLSVTQTPPVTTLPVATLPPPPVPISIPVPLPQTPQTTALPVATLPTAPAPVPLPQSITLPQMPQPIPIPVPAPQSPPVTTLPVATLPPPPVPIPLPQTPQTTVLPVATLPTAPVPVALPQSITLPQMPQPIPIPVPQPPPGAWSGPTIPPPFPFQMDRSELPFNDAQSLPPVQP